MQSPRQIHISNFASRGYVYWFQLLLNKGKLFPLDDGEKQKMLHYATILLKQTWMIRNQVRLCGCLPEWEAFADQVSRLTVVYLSTGISKAAVRKRRQPVSIWIPPPLGEFKFNVDISFFGNDAMSVIVLRNHFGVIKGTWINHFLSSNLFCA